MKTKNNGKQADNCKNIEKKNSTYKVELSIWYYEPYLPKRCRKMRYEKKQETVKIGIKNVTSEQAPVAFRLSDYHHRTEHKTVVRCYGRKLYEPMLLNDIYAHGGFEAVTPEMLANYVHPYFTLWTDRSRELCLTEYRKDVKKYIVIDGEVWRECGEPRYVVNTFGLGHNHGGTGLFVEKWYNDNIPNRNYFSALDGDKAVAWANQVAARRGDTNDVGTFETMIEVLLPQYVKVKPMKEHGEGDPFINRINRISEVTGSPVVAGIMAVGMAMADK